MQLGICGLCGQYGELHDGHIGLRAAYKQYVTGKGGRFYESKVDKILSRQHTSFMFCQQCETVRLGQLDSRGVKLLRTFESDPQTSPFVRDWFLRWAVSLSFRVLFDHTKQHPSDVESVTEPLQHWRNLLLGKETNVTSFTQHAFLSYSEETRSGFQRMVDWKYVPDDGLTLHQMGPLIVLGVTRRTNRSKEQRRAAEACMIKPEGCYVQRFDVLKRGVNIPDDMDRVIRRRNIELLENVLSSKLPEITDQVCEWDRRHTLAVIAEQRQWL
jgi:hypothetical protein